MAVVVMEVSWKMIILLTLFGTSAAMSWNNSFDTLIVNRAYSEDLNSASKQQQLHSYLKSVSQSAGDWPLHNLEEEELDIVRNGSRRLRRMGKKRVPIDEDMDASSTTSTSDNSHLLPPPPISSESTSSQGQSPNCPSGNAQGTLKVVSDITKETSVELITDSHLPQRFKSPPKPVMSNPSLLNPLCSKYAWRFCPEPKRGAEDKNWYTCEARQFVGKIHCAFIDNQHTIPGMVYDHQKTYPVHGCHPHQKGFQPQPAKKVVRLDKVAHNLAVYPTGFAHVMAQLPRLIILAQSIPKDVPILLAKSSARDSFVNLLHEKGILDKKRIMNWDPNTVYFANTVYYAGEMGRGVGTSGKWDTLKVEFCSWALVMPRERLQRIFIGDYTKQSNPLLIASSEAGQSPTEVALTILVVHRKDASGQRRMIKNHNVMLAAIKSTFRNSKVIEFVGDKFSLSESISAFSTADVVVAPHGAALGFLAFMRPGTSCVEIGYKDLKGMKFPAPYYMALALSVNVGYFLSMAEGGYGSPLTADVNDVVAVTKLAVAYAADPSAPHPNVY